MSYGLPCYVILEELENALAALAAPHKGEVVQAHDPAEALELLGNAPTKWRIVLGVDDEDNAEGERRNTGKTGTSITQFFTIVQAPPGLAAKPNKQRVLELAEAVRAWMRGLILQHANIDCQTGFVWQKSTWVKGQQEGKPVQFGRQHIFDLVHQISNPVQIAPITITYPTP